MSAPLKATISVIIIATALCCSPLRILFETNSPNIALNYPDSTQYLEMAAQTLSYDPTPYTQHNPIPGSLLRPPLYPGLLSATFALWGVNPTAILILHALVAIICIGCSAYLLRKTAPLALWVVIELLSLRFISAFYSYVGPEWIATCVTIVLVSVIARYLFEPTLHWLIVANLLVVLLAISRFELIWLFFLVAAIAMIAQHTHARWWGAAGALLSIAAVVIIKTMTLPSQHGLLGALSLLQSTKDLPPFNYPHAATCVETQALSILNSRGDAVTCFEDIATLHAHCKASWKEVSHVLIYTSMLRILQFPVEFFSNIVNRSWPLIIGLPFLAIFTVGIKRFTGHSVAAYIALIASLIFCFQILLIATINVMVDRYYLPQLSLLAFGLMSFFVHLGSTRSKAIAGARRVFT